MPSSSHASAFGGDAEELAVIRQVAEGERQALRWVYDRYAARCMAVALRILRSSSEAEEVVQETFVDVWRRAPEYEAARGSPQAWIATICRTRAIDRLRSRAANARVITQLQIDPPVGPSPVEAAERRQIREQIESALSRLPPEQRKVLELAYFEGLSQSEIASRTGEALGTVKTRVRLGMEKLAVLLAEVKESLGGDFRGSPGGRP
jgi:RNA polymerase sigma-70 factor (ECF subfamily)